MPFDFDVAASAVADVLARPITVYPIVSQPHAAQYNNRGIWRRKAEDIPMEQGVLSTVEQTLVVRNRDYAVIPAAGDKINIPAVNNLPALGLFEVTDADPQGDNRTILTLEEITS